MSTVIDTIKKLLHSTSLHLSEGVILWLASGFENTQKLEIRVEVSSRPGSYGCSECGSEHPTTVYETVTVEYPVTVTDEGMEVIGEPTMTFFPEDLPNREIDWAPIRVKLAEKMASAKYVNPLELARGKARRWALDSSRDLLKEGDLKILDLLLREADDEPLAKNWDFIFHNLSQEDASSVLLEEGSLAGVYTRLLPLAEKAREKRLADMAGREEAERPLREDRGKSLREEAAKVAKSILP